MFWGNPFLLGRPPCPAEPPCAGILAGSVLAPCSTWVGGPSLGPAQETSAAVGAGGGAGSGRWHSSSDPPPALRPRPPSETRSCPCNRNLLMLLPVLEDTEGSVDPSQGLSPGSSFPCLRTDPACDLRGKGSQVPRSDHCALCTWIARSHLPCQYAQSPCVG